VLFHQGAPVLGAGTLRTGQGLAALRDVSAACLWPAGQLQVATALEVPGRWRTGCTRCCTSCWPRPGTLPTPRALAARLYGVGPSPRWR
jgi:hypothetical protein